MATKRTPAKNPARKKTATVSSSKTRRATNTNPSATAARVSIRMYRQGLGDCFLVSFPTASKTPFNILIDCGVVLGTPDPVTPMKRVVEDIARVTTGQIDLLVVTHEHWDHVSGFNQVQDQFEKLKIQQVWVAWTEDPTDPLANKLRAERRTVEDALRMAVNHLALAGDADTAERVDSLIGFFGATSGSTRDAFDYAKKRSPGGRPRYCRPGEPPIALPELPNVRFWILGPPKDEKLIKKSNPSQNDAYGLDASPDGSQALLIAGLKRGIVAAAETSVQDDSIDDPFERTYSIPMERAEQLSFFKKRYYGNADDGSIYEKSTGKEIRDQSWRRIDSAWMGTSETMALQLDSATNNTSLVLAIELIATGEILLFPGDAQGGNWLSWQDLQWEIDDRGNKKIVTGPDLLKRTIFYKVGHHGSHNATLKAKGLELMVNEGLVAMIPVDHAMAVKKRWGRMPLPELMDRIKEKTRGRVLRVDDAAKTTADLANLKPDDLSPADWKQFTDRVQVTDLYYQISL
jgi:predicted metallo-beta-lactamase superfamily hydrolase